MEPSVADGKASDHGNDDDDKDNDDGDDDGGDDDGDGYEFQSCHKKVRLTSMQAMQAQ